MNHKADTFRRLSRSTCANSCARRMVVEVDWRGARLGGHRSTCGGVHGTRDTAAAGQTHGIQQIRSTQTKGRFFRTASASGQGRSASFLRRVGQLKLWCLRGFGLVGRKQVRRMTLTRLAEAQIKVVPDTCCPRNLLGRLTTRNTNTVS